MARPARRPAAERERLALPEPLFDRLIRHARECLPEECCGILIGSNLGGGERQVTEAIAATNASTSPREKTYRVPPIAILDAQRAARGAGLEIVGYYHSHPNGSARPSALDLRDAWPETSYVIVGLEAAELREIRSWRLEPGGTGFVEETLICRRESS